MRQKTRTVLRLRQLRRSREMTQEELARRAGLSKGAVCDIELGRRKPSLESAKMLAAVFGESIERTFEYVEIAS